MTLSMIGDPSRIVRKLEFSSWSGALSALVCPARVEGRRPSARSGCRSPRVAGVKGGFFTCSRPQFGGAGHLSRSVVIQQTTQALAVSYAPTFLQAPSMIISRVFKP